MEQISVIIPVYNVENYLPKCIDSVINQTYSNLQIILVDDGSDDASGDICDVYAKKDDRVCVVHKSNGGTAESRNYGLDLATGDYICFVDSDDYLSLDMIEILYKKVRDSKSDMSVCGFNCIREIEGRTEKTDIYLPFCDEIIEEKEIAFERLLNGFGVYYVVVWNKLYKKKIWNELRFDKNRMCEDEYIVHKIIDKCNRIVCIKDKLYYYMQNDNSKTHIMEQTDIFIKDQVDAYIQRMRFFKSRGYQSMVSLQHENMLYEIMEKLQSLTNKQTKLNLLDYLKNSIGEEIRDINSEIYIKYSKTLNAYMKYPQLVMFIFLLKRKLINLWKGDRNQR